MESKRAIKQLNFLRSKMGDMRLAAEYWKNDFQTLIAIILSSRTKDETTIRICKILFKKYPNVNKFSLAKPNEILKIIKPINFYKNKTKNIIRCAKILVEKYDSKVPHNFEELIKLPGVGRKTANVFLAESGGANIGVDTHVGYISQKLGWTNNKNPHKIEEDLKKLFPKKYWRIINYILVKFGKKYTLRKEKDKILDYVKNLK